MSSALATHKRILAIDPCTRGFGFAVLEGPERLIDWGVKEARSNKNARCVRQIADLISCYRPDAIVIEDYADTGCRRCLRVRKLLQDIRKLAARKRIKTYRFSGRAVSAAFSQSGACTKHQITSIVAKCLPELAPRQPPFRKPWMSEDQRMRIFSAVAFVFTFFYFTNKNYDKKATPP